MSQSSSSSSELRARFIDIIRTCFGDVLADDAVLLDEPNALERLSERLSN